MANRLAQEVEKILAAAVGDFIAKATEPVAQTAQPWLRAAAFSILEDAACG